MNVTNIHWPVVGSWLHCAGCGKRLLTYNGGTVATSCECGAYSPILVTEEMLGSNVIDFFSVQRSINKKKKINI